MKSLRIRCQLFLYHTIICNDAINRAIKYLEENHSVKEKVYLHIAEGFDCIESPDGQKGFGCYIPSEKSIYLAEEIPDKETSIIETLAHEYKHFMQDCLGQEFDENEAEQFANQVLKDMESEDTDHGND
jgi:hypothetical protein